MGVHSDGWLRWVNRHSTGEAAEKYCLLIGCCIAIH